MNTNNESSDQMQAQIYSDQFNQALQSPIMSLSISDILSNQQRIHQYHENMSDLEMKASEKHTQITFEAAKQTQRIRYKRHQLHLQIENKKNIRLALMFNKFESWVKKMSDAVNIINCANRKCQNCPHCHSYQPMTFIITDIPTQTINNSPYKPMVNTGD